MTELIDFEKQGQHLIKLPLKEGDSWFKLTGIPNLYNIMKEKNMLDILQNDNLSRLSDDDITFIPNALGLNFQEDKIKLVNEILNLKSYYQITI